MKNNKKQALVKQSTRFRMHKSGKFWIFSSLTQMSWLNLGKKSAGQLHVKLEQPAQEYQQIYSDDEEDESPQFSRGLKVAGGLVAGLGLSVLGNGLTSSHTFADTT